MDQFVGHGEAGETVHQLLTRVAPARIRARAEALEAAENALIERDEHDTQMAYASAISEYADAGGYEHETVWDQCSVAALGVPFERARYRELTTLSGGEQKRLALEALLRGPDEVLLLDEPDTTSMSRPSVVGGAASSDAQDRAAVSHDRELLAPCRRPADHARAGRQPVPRRGCTVEGSPPTSKRGPTGWTASTSCVGAGTSSTRSCARWSRTSR